MALEELAPLIKRLVNEKGFKAFTEPQLKAIPPILESKNVLIVAPTGSGKTEAALLPIFQIMMKERRKGISVVYITPLRALNRDMIDRIIWWSNRLGFRVNVRHGDTSTKERRLQAELPPDILITTPETFSLLLNTRTMSKHLENVRWIVIDEIHELVNNKRGAQLSINIERLSKKIGKIQRIGLSATIGTPDKVLKYLVGTEGDGIIVDIDISKSIEISVEYPKANRKDYIDSSRLYTYPDVVARIRNIMNLIKYHKATLVFTNTRPMAEILGSRLYLYEEDIPIMVHHGSLSRNIRVRIERFLKEGKIKAIICTSSLELGIDVGDIDYVIQYNSPRQVSRIIQRVGRSGHWIERTSKGTIIVQDMDDLIESIVIRNKVYKKEIEPINLIKKPYDVLLHEIAGMLITRQSIDINEIMDILRKSYVYKDITQEELIKLLDFASNLTNKFIHLDKLTNSVKRPINRRRLFEYYFSILSMIPEVRQFIVIDDSTNTPIGILDEEFVATYGEPNTKFIMAGKPWKIIQVYKDKVYVNPEEDFFGAIPDWVGEEIPVPYEVAQEVGKVKENIKNIYQKIGKNKEKLKIEIEKQYGHSLYENLEPYIEHLEEDIPIPTHKEILIEKFSDKIIIYIHGGTIVNRTLAGYLSNVLLEEYGEVVNYSSDPYRIFIQSITLEPKIIREIFTGNININKYIRKTIETSRIFLWRIIHVARRMGIVSKEKTIDYREAEILQSSIKGTPAYEEAFNECIFKDFDLKGATQILENLRTNKLKIYIHKKGPTPISRYYLQYNEIKFERPRLDRLKTLQILSTRARLMNEVRTYACVKCMKYISENRVRDLPEIVKCPICGEKLIGIVDDLPEEVEKILDYALNRPDYIKRNHIWRKLVRTSKLINKYGKTAAFILSSPNITLKDAENILKIEDKMSGKLIQLLIEAEKKNLLRRFQ